MNEYNTSKTLLILKEYGRNVQKLVDYILTIEDKEKRTNYSKTLVELMRQINPAMRDAQDYSQKLWDDLYIMSQFKLDVDGPYVMPEASALGKKPKKLNYTSNRIKYKHYGRNVELLIAKAVLLEDEAEREGAIIYIGRLMKSFYGTWNKENVDDAVILEHMIELSKNRLKLDLTRIKSEGLFETNVRDKDRVERDRGDIREKPDNMKPERKLFKKPKRPNDMGNNNSTNNNNNKRRKI